jgi:tetratricopeptide (TPR) repeat protein
MLETIHEYAREKLLQSGEAQAMNRQHAAYFLALAEEAAPKLQGREQANTIRQIEENLDNMRTAIRWALEQGDAEDAARIAGALWGFMWSRGYLSEGRRWLEATLESPNLSVDVRATALRACGILAHDQGDYERAHACFEETLALRRQQDDKSGIAGALNALGVLTLRGGDFQAAKPYYVEALTLFRELEDQARMAVALNNLGVLAERLGDFEQAQDYYGQSLDLARRQGDSEGVAWALDNLGNIACEQGRYEDAWKMHRESLTLFQDQGDMQGIIAALEHIASLEGAQQRGEEAARLFGAAELLREQTGAVIHPSNRDSHDRRIATARAGLDEAIWNAAWQEGRTMPLEQALAHAAQPQERQKERQT